MHLTRGRLVLTGLLLLPAPLRLAAQDADARPAAVMRGAVQNLEGIALEGAQVEVLGLDRKATTSASGAYRLADIAPGRYWVVVRRIGFDPLRVALTFDPGSDREITFQLDALPYRLEDVDVTASEDRVWARKFQAFLWRSRSGWGKFLTRDDIERARPLFLSDVVRRHLPGVPSQAWDHAPYAGDFVSASWGPNGALGWSYASRTMTGCAPAVSIDGATPMGAWAVNDFMPGDVEALEIYRRGRDLPIEFQRTAGSSCGLVIIWLK